MELPIGRASDPAVVIILLEQKDRIDEDNSLTGNRTPCYMLAVDRLNGEGQISRSPALLSCEAMTSGNHDH